MPMNEGVIPLGSSDILVGRMGWGMWRLAQSNDNGATVARRVVAAVDAGCTLLDTADVYGYGGPGFGAAEQLLGAVFDAIPGLRYRAVVATKAGVTPPVPYNSGRNYLVAACEASLRRLRTDVIDLFQIHRPDLLAHPAEVAAALDKLRKDGKIRAAGVSNYTAEQTRALVAHLPFALATIQPEFSAAATAALTDGTLDLAMELGLGVLAWSPLAQGRLTTATPDGSLVALLQTLDDVASQLQVTRTAVAYAWVMQHPASPIPLIGSQNPDRIREATASAGLRLPPQEWYRILVSSRGSPMP